MKSYKIFLFFLFVIGLVGAFSCKKKSNSSPFANARIATVDYLHSGAIQHYRIVYDQYSNVDSIVVTGDGTAIGNNGFKEFTYFGTSYSIKDENSNSFTVLGNSAGQVLKVLQADTLIMTYKSNQLDELDHKIPSIVYPYYTLTSYYYTWVGGDMTFVGLAGTGTSGKTYYYDQSHNGQPGDPLRVSDFLSIGRSYIKTNHLPKGLVVASDTIEKYYYQFEGTGRISQLVKVNSSTGVDDSMIYNYKYY